MILKSQLSSAFLPILVVATHLFGSFLCFRYVRKILEKSTGKQIKRRIRITPTRKQIYGTGARSLSSHFVHMSVNSLTPIPNDCPAYKSLDRRLAKEKRRLDCVEGDGNCFFRAISKHMHGTENYHDSVRALIVDLISNNGEDFEQFVDDENIEAHSAEMSSCGIWATTCEIYAAATLLERDIYVMSPSYSKTGPRYTWLHFQPLFDLEESVEADELPGCYITLCHTNGNHYDRVVPRHEVCNCLLPHPVLGSSQALCSSKDCQDETETSIDPEEGESTEGSRTDEPSYFS